MKLYMSANLEMRTLTSCSPPVLHHQFCVVITGDVAGGGKDADHPMAATQETLEQRLVVV